MKKSDQKLTIFYFIFDILLLNVSIVFLLMFRYDNLTQVRSDYRQFFFIYNLIWICVVLFNRTYSNLWREEYKLRLFQFYKGMIIYIGLISITLVIIKEPVFSRIVVYGSLFLFLILRTIIGFFVFRLVGRLRYEGKNNRKILVIGAGRVGRRIFEIIHKNRELGFKIIGFIDDHYKENHLNHMILGKVDDLENIVSSVNIDEILIALPLTTKDKINHAIDVAERFGLRIRLIPDYYSLLGRSSSIDYLGDLPIINIRAVPLDDFVNYSTKRFFDFLFSLIVLILVFPLLITVGLLVLLDIRGNIFYKPVRIGSDGKKFRLYKFRTMHENDDEVNGSASTVPDDPRVTKLGSVLRKYNLDELPQFYNVLKGDMSVVGPRPHRLWLTETLKNELDCYMPRHYVKPGITGWAQVNGWRGLMDTMEKKEQRLKHDLWYMENWSLWLDIKIIFMTIFSKKTYQNAM